MKNFTEHLKKQGFHIVFASETSTNDLEIGLCNVRTENDQGKIRGPWFAARLLCSKNNFSAVMKAEDPSLVPQHVKNFKLAKVLKIDKGK